MNEEWRRKTNDTVGFVCIRCAWNWETKCNEIWMKVAGENYGKEQKINVANATAEVVWAVPCVCVCVCAMHSAMILRVVMFIICIFPRPCLLSLLQFCVYPALFILFLRNFQTESYNSKAKPNQTKGDWMKAIQQIFLSLSARNRLTHWFLMAYKLIYFLESFIWISCLQSNTLMANLRISIQF